MKGERGKTMVSAAAVLRDFDVTNATLYRMAKDGRLHPKVTKKKGLARASYLFDLSEVERVLDRKPAN